MISRHFLRYVAVVLFIAVVGLGGWIHASAQDPMPEVSLILSSSGFNPAEVRPQAGRFLLSIDNRSGVSDLVLRLNRADGSQVRELRISGAGGDWSETFDLSPGTYSLSEANHSSWLCTIIVQ